MTELHHQLYLATGSNLGDRQANLAQANALIAEKIGPVEQVSAFYETEAWGLTDQPDFLNQVLKVNTHLEPKEVLAQIIQIELLLGRERQEKWGPRLIDIDILFYDDLIIKTDNLTIPHPFIQDRNFVLIPLLEIAGEKIHPIYELTIEDLYLQCKDIQEVVQLETE